MHPRPAPIGRKPHAGSSTASNRLSAVYIGSNPSITNSPLSSSHFTVLSTPPVDIAEESIPDLPDPPSPEGSVKSGSSRDSSSPERRRRGTLGRNNSGLPSPPATNSTGSGSTRSKGDDQERILEDLKKGKERPVSLASSSGSSTSMSTSVNGRGGFQDMQGMASSSSSPMLHTARRALHRNSSSVGSVNSAFERATRANEDGMLMDMKSPPSLIPEIDRDEGDGDETARYDIHRSQTSLPLERKAANDNSEALQRVKSLTQRNKMTLDKLSSYPRASSSSPRPPSSASRLSHTRSATSAGSAGSHSRSQSNSQPRASTSRTVDDADPHNVLSGSETERESASARSVSSHARSTTSAARRLERERVEREREQQRAPSRTRPRTPTTPPQRRTRVPSAPESPFTALTMTNTTLNRTGIGDRGRESPAPLSSHSSPSRRKRVSLATPPRLGYSVSSSAADDEDEGGTGASPYGEFGERSNVRAHSSLALVTPMGDFDERRRMRESMRESRGSRDTRDVMQAALAAVASSRRGAPLDQASNSGSGASGGSGGRTRSRAALPFEFRNAGDSPRMTTEPEPMTPLRATSLVYTNSNSSSNTTTSAAGSIATNISGSSSMASFRSRPMSAISASSASLRSQRKPWGSEDYRRDPPYSSGGGNSPHSAGRSPRRDRHSTEYVGMAEYRERRQSLRGGSAESVLSNGTYGRSLVGEGLRAAGLGRPHRLSLGAGRTLLPLSFPAEHEEEGEEGRQEVRARRDTIVPSRMGDTHRSRAATSLGNYHHSTREREEDVNRAHERDVDMERRPLRSARSSLTPSARERSLARDEGIDRAPSALSRYGALRTSVSHTHLIRDREREAGTLSPYGARRQSTQPPTPGNGAQQEHTKLLVESLVMFESQLSRLAGLGADDTIRNAHVVVGLAEHLNDLLRSNNYRCLDEQVKAEVEDAAVGGNGRVTDGRDVAEPWTTLGVEFRDGLRMSDELIRSLTSFLLGVGRVTKDIGEPGAHHGRTVSLDEEGLRRRGSFVAHGTPDVFATGGSDGRRSQESRRSSDQPRESVDAFIATRRASARAESSLGQVRSVLRDGTRLSTPPPGPPSESSSRHSAGATSGTGQAMRRLFTPREQRERDRELTMQQQPDIDYRHGMPTIRSQEALQSYEPSPTPGSRALDSSQATVRNQTLPSIPKPLPTLPSETLLHHQQREGDSCASPSARPTDTIRDSTRKRDRRTASIIIPSRGPSTSSTSSSFPVSLTTPSNATTALTPHTVSNTSSPQTDKATFPSLRRGDSDNTSSSRSPAVTFSRPSTISVSALNGLQQKDGEHRRRTESGGSNGAEPSSSYVPERFKEVMSGSETERPRDSKLLRSRTLGPSRVAARASLDGQVAAIRAATGTVNAADRSAAFSAGGATTRGERRRTVTDIWPQT